MIGFFINPWMQIYDGSRDPTPPVDNNMSYEDSEDMAFEDGEIMSYE